MSTVEHVSRCIRLRSRKDGAWSAPPELKPRLVEDAIAHGSNMNQVMCEILAGHYRVAHAPAGQPRRASPNGYELELRMPAALDRTVAANAGGNGRTVPGEVIAVLSAHYGLEVPAPPIRRRRRRRSAARAA